MRNIFHQPYSPFVSFPRDAEISRLKEASVALEDKISQMTSEKQELLVKIEAGDGASTALTQLKQENVSGK